MRRRLVDGTLGDEDGTTDEVLLRRWNHRCSPTQELQLQVSHGPGDETTTQVRPGDGTPGEAPTRRWNSR